MIVSMGVLGLVAGTATLLGLRWITAAMAAPLEYLKIVFALIIGYLIWSEVPNLVTMIGACLITVAGLMAARLQGAKP
jgi:drug/metabolite transporter (DMT)-like permease